MQLLLFSDDVLAARRLSERLVISGFAMAPTRNLEKLSVPAKQQNAAAIMVDIGLTGPLAKAVVQVLRHAGYEQPLLVLTGRDDWQERIECLDAGADECLVKPVRSEEIGARIRTIIRRSGGNSSNLLAFGEVELDLKSRSATLAGKALDLTRNELRVLGLFMLRPSQVLSSDDIRERLYPSGSDRSNNAVEVHIARLRRKIGRARIRTVRGLGYRLVEVAHTSCQSLVESADKSPIIDESF